MSRFFPAAAFLLPALALTGCVRVLVADDSVSFTDPVDHVVVDLDAGSVELVGADVAEVTVERHVESTEGNAPTLVAEVVDGVLTLSADCPDKPLALCLADHRVVLPAAVQADLTTGSGDVTVSNLAGELVATTGSGAVAVSDVAGAVTVDTGSGAIALSGALGAVDAHTGSGAVIGDALDAPTLAVATGSGSIDLRVVAAIVSLAADTGSGDVDLRVPGGAYALDVASDAGDVALSGVTDDANAASLRAHTGSGAIAIVGE